jgi:hypothetical protein
MVYFVIYIMIFKLKYFTVLSCVLAFNIVFQETYLNNKSRCNIQIKVIFYKSAVMPPKILKVFLDISKN